VTRVSLGGLVGGVAAVAAVCVATAAVLAVRIPVPRWDSVALAVALGVAGYHLQVNVRIAGQRLMFVWCHTAVAVALVLEPAPWVVLTTAVGIALATFGPRGPRPRVKAFYNTALFTVSATAAAAAYQALHPVLALNPWRTPAAVVVVMLLFSVIEDVGVQGVIAVASGRRFATIWRGGAGVRGMQLATDLILSVASGVAALAEPRLLVALPVVAFLLHMAHCNALVTRLDP